MQRICFREPSTLGLSQGYLRAILGLPNLAFHRKWNGEQLPACCSAPILLLFHINSV